MNIPQSEIKYSSLSLLDIGRVFWWQGRLFRGIPAEHAPLVRQMFDSGLISKLIEEGLFVRSWTTPLELDGFGLVVEHEVVKPPVYPREWTFSMLKDAALLVLELNQVAAEFSFQTKDCHGYNVLFQDGKPVYVDLGSLTPVTNRGQVLLAYEEFLRCYYYPLQIWRSVGGFLGTQMASWQFAKMPREAYLKIRWPVFRAFSDATLRRVMKAVHKIETLAHRDLAKDPIRAPGWTDPILLFLQKTKFTQRPATIERLKEKITKLANPAASSKWADYHDGFNQIDGLSSTPRFDHVIEKLTSLEVASVMEIAGNQGVLSRLIKQRAGKIRVICTDRDSVALDKGYQAEKNARLGVNWAVLDPFVFESSSIEIAPNTRFKSDAVVALALTHHLILKQGFEIGFILDTIGGYSNKYVLIEFMPQGLTDGVTFPEFPAWYTVDWFKGAFENRFEIIEQKQLEPNRILFIGTKA